MSDNIRHAEDEFKRYINLLRKIQTLVARLRCRALACNPLRVCAQGRQKRPVAIYRLIMQESIEERILALHRDKRDLASELLDGAEVAGRLSEDELLALIRG